MAWTTPRTWQTDEVVTAGMLNEQVRDNLVALKDPPTHSIVLYTSVSYTTTSTTFVPVDSTNLKLTLTTNGGDVMLGFMARVSADSSTGRRISFDIRVDGSGAWAEDQGFTEGLITFNIYLNQDFALTPVLITGLSAGEHTFELLWKVNQGSGTIYGTTTPIIFWAREVS